MLDVRLVSEVGQRNKRLVFIVLSTILLSSYPTAVAATQCSSIAVTVRQACVDSTALLWLFTDDIMSLHAWTVPAFMQGQKQQEGCCISHDHIRFQAAAHPGRSRHPALTVY